MDSRLTGRTSGILKASIALIAALIWLCPAPDACRAQGTPSIEVDKKELDLGVIYRGGSAEGDFVIRNVGSDTLAIKNVRSSCGCTAAIVDKNNLGPNEQTKLKARFSSGNYKGTVSKKIFVYSNDPQNAIIALEVKAEVKVDLDVSPMMIYFSGLKAGDRVSRLISLKNVSDSTITIQEISSTVPDIKIDLSKMKIAPGEESSLRLVVDKLEKDTKLTGSLTIRTTSRQEKITVQIYGGKIR
ncbi:MAG: DUF1573 domain-containing protein [Candidatus Glassbacteria bacterium]|nr:DUF1573 domain-containing protein [Candidatus Glassbacteria bacterium]